MELQSNNFLAQAQAAIEDAPHAVYREALGRDLPQKRLEAIEDFGGADSFEKLREHVRSIRQHSLRHLAHYLQRFVNNARDNGNQVHFARDGEELNQVVLEICLHAEAKRIIKGKSMITEECELNSALLDAGLQVRETDLGEYIIQEAGEKPSHIVGPALHKTEAEIRDLFLDKHALGERALAEAEEMVAEARQVLRQDFLEADVGIIGSNALIAENGYSMLVTNEGNGDLCANLPRTLIICTSIERVLPRAKDAMAMLRLLVRSTTGQSVTGYTSFYSGSRRETDLDGPLETHIVLLDNRRSEILASDYSEMLQCVRCGACLNHCPIYMSAGGHAYGSVYPGPMGSILTPLLTSLEESAALPNACTACGRCEEVCPAAIPIPDLLRTLRSEQFTQGITPHRWRLGIRLHAWLVAHPAVYRTVTGVTAKFLYFLGKRTGRVRRFPLAGAWLEARDLPAAQSETFMQRYRRESKQ